MRQELKSAGHCKKSLRMSQTKIERIHTETNEQGLPIEHFRFEEANHFQHPFYFIRKTIQIPKNIYYVLKSLFERIKSKNIQESRICLEDDHFSTITFENDFLSLANAKVRDKLSEEELIFVLEKLAYAGCLLEEALVYHEKLSPDSIKLFIADNSSVGVRLENPFNTADFLNEYG